MLKTLNLQIKLSIINLQVARLPHIRKLSRELLLDIVDALADDMSESRLCPDVSSLSLTDWRLPFPTLPFSS